MNESNLTVPKEARLAMLTLLALLAALMALQVFSAKPAEAGVILCCQGGSGSSETTNLGGLQQSRQTTISRPREVCQPSMACHMAAILATRA
jgi:hypothetical protein